MATELLFGMFLRAQLAGSLAVLLVLLLRLPARRLFGAELAYCLWLLVPAAALGSLFPALPEWISRADIPGRLLRQGRFVDWSPVVANARVLACAWAAGMLIFLALLLLAQLRFAAAERAGRAGPAATGFWPRMVVPSDHVARFTAEERALIRAHERVHMGRRDPTTNLAIALAVAASWFNPLAHLAAHLARMDQELSVDAQVIGLYPKGRRRYAETLLKAHARGLASPLACALALGGRHPLEVRLSRLGVARISVRRDRIGAAAVGLLVVAMPAVLIGLAPI